MKKRANKIDWKKGNGLVPAVVQDASTGAVLMLGYMNPEALRKTKASGFVWFWSRTKKRLWMKGEASGNKLKVEKIYTDCDGDTLLIRALPLGPVCHTGTATCFGQPPAPDPIKDLFAVILDRRKNMPRRSYTAALFKGGVNKISLKVSEEALEVIQAAQKETKKRLTEESVDLIYHLFVLLAERRVAFEAVEKEIQKRRK